MDIKVMIAVVSNRGVKPKTTLSLMRLVNYTIHEVYPFIAEQGYTIGENRTVCAIEALRQNCTHLLFIDDDMTFPEDTLDKLIEHDKDIVGVWSFSRTLPLSPTIMFLEGENYLPQDKMTDEQLKRKTEVFECFAVGMGVCLIDMRLFKEDKLGKPWFNFKVSELGKVDVGEDAWFCAQAKRAGYSVWCDPKLSIGHIGDYIYNDVEYK
jgi:hypothetical protein